MSINQRKAGVLLSYASMGINSVIGFVFIPVLLMFLSKEQYGLYQLAASMIGYLMIMDFGLTVTTTRYYSIYLARNEELKKQNLLALNLIIYCVISLLIACAGVLGIYFLLPFYTHTLPLQDIITLKYVLFILIFNVAVVVPGNIFMAVINSHEKFIFARGLNLANIISQPVFIYIILHFSSTVIAIAVVQTLCNVVIVLLNVWYCFSKLKIKIKLHSWNSRFVKEIMTFSLFVFMPGIIALSYWKTGQIVLGAASGAAAVATYSVAVQIATAFMSIAESAGSVFLPKISAITAKTDDMLPINNIFLKIGRIQFLLISLVLTGFIIYGREFIVFWVGADFGAAYNYALIFMGGLFVCLMQTTGVAVLRAKNKHKFRAIIYAALGILNIIISIPATKAWGAMGCAMATGACLLTGQTVIMTLYFKHIGLSTNVLLSQIIKMAIPIAIVFLFTFWINGFINSESPFLLMVKMALYCILFFIAAWKFSLNDYEKNLLLTLGELRK